MFRPGGAGGPRGPRACGAEKEIFAFRAGMSARQVHSYMPSVHITVAVVTCCIEKGTEMDRIAMKKREKEREGKKERSKWKEKGKRILPGRRRGT